jgi:glycosyltransferase involved in cell wall biosynthesis
MTGRPLVSVIIPCYNLGPYIDEAIQSVLSQTVQDVEILVVDDGSTDPATTDLLRSSHWPQTRIFFTANRGLAAARNFLVEQAAGEFLCALDADDKLHPEYLARTLDALRRDRSLTFVSSRFRMFGDDDRVLPQDLTCDLPTLLCDDPVFCAALVRRADVRAVGGYDDQMPAQGDEDWDLWIRLLERGGTGLILPDILFFYRRRRGSMCDSCTERETHLQLIDYLITKHRDSYRRHLPQVLLNKDRQLARLQRATEEAGNGGGVSDDILLEQLRTTLVALENKRRSAQLANNTDSQLAALRESYEHSRAEVAALRASLSWRMTAPFRAAFDLLFSKVGRDSK